MRRVPVAAMTLAVACMAVLSSCTAPIDGITGVTVDEAGNVLGVIASCKHKMVVGSMYRTGGIDEATPPPDMGFWHLRGDSTRELVTWPLTAGRSPTSTAEGTVAPLLLKGEMAVSAGSADKGSYSTGEVAFRLSETKKLHPNQILTWDFHSADTNHDYNTVVSGEKFRHLACGNFKISSPKS